MNKTAIKNFAVWARNTLIAQMVQRAYEYEIIDGAELNENQRYIGDKAMSDEVFSQRYELVMNIKERGFQNVMEEAAYTWFNRFTALRFMEVNGYLPSRVRIFSDADGHFKPEILREALTVEIDGLDRELIVEMLDKQENEKLYKYLIITQCNALNRSIPALFEKLGGWTELMFPSKLLLDGSVLQHMVEDIPEEDWKDQVQIIGWLYQYYNSEPKDKVFADLKKNIKVSRENIPAATQLFTPDWIVRYMVENSLGRIFADNASQSEKEFAEKMGWKYYLPEAEENRNLKAEPVKKLDLSQIKFLDPCMGSGHILVYAFDVFMQMYTASGWSERDAAAVILSKNLYGLDIDKRAYQLAYFSVIMKAMRYDRRFLRRNIQLNLSYFQDMPSADTLLLPKKIECLAKQLENADTFGSLISVKPIEGIDDEVGGFTGRLGFTSGDLEHLMRLYVTLSQKYDVVCTNPPYMGGGNMNGVLSEFVKKNYPDSKSDLFACFIERCGEFTKQGGYYAMITQHAWMFLSSYEKLRAKLLRKTFVSMAHLGARAFDEIGGEVVQTTAFIHKNAAVSNYLGTYVRMVDTVGETEKEAVFCSGNNRYAALQSNFSKIPGSPVAYWVGEKVFEIFSNANRLEEFADVKGGLVTGNNDLFLRKWYEI